jgi:hypothetical protein
MQHPYKSKHRQGFCQIQNKFAFFQRVPCCHVIYRIDDWKCKRKVSHLCIQFNLFCSHNSSNQVPLEFCKSNWQLHNSMQKLLFFLSNVHIKTSTDIWIGITLELACKIVKLNWVLKVNYFIALSLFGLIQIQQFYILS